MRESMADATIDDLLAQPWTRRGPVKDQENGEVFYRVTIDELPGFLVVGPSPYDVIMNERRALRAFLAARLEAGVRITPPVGLDKPVEPETPPEPTLQESHHLALDSLLGEPWTRRGPEKAEIAGEVFYKLTIAELPGFVVTGLTPFEVINNERRALRSYLADQLDRGNDIPRASGNAKD